MAAAAAGRTVIATTLAHLPLRRLLQGAGVATTTMTGATIGAGRRIARSAGAAREIDGTTTVADDTTRRMALAGAVGVRHLLAAVGGAAAPIRARAREIDLAAAEATGEAVVAQTVEDEEEEADGAAARRPAATVAPARPPTHRIRAPRRVGAQGQTRGRGGDRKGDRARRHHVVGELRQRFCRRRVFGAG